MSDYQVDRLEISAESNLSKVNSQIDNMIGKLGKLANKLESDVSGKVFSKLSQEAKELGTTMNIVTQNVSSSVNRMQGDIAKATKQGASDVARLSEKAKSALDIKGTPNGKVQIMDESAKQNVDNTIVSIERVKSLLASMNQPLGVGQRYSQEFLDLKKNIEVTTEKLEHYRAKQEQANRLGFNTDTQSAKKLADNIELTEKKLQQYVADLERMKQDGNVVADQGKGFIDLSKDISFAGTMLSKFGNILKSLNFDNLGNAVKNVGRLFNNTATVANNAGQKMTEVGNKAQQGMATAGSAVAGASAKVSGLFAKIPVVGWVIVAVIGAIAVQVVKLKVMFTGFTSIIKGIVTLFTKLWSTAGKALKSIVSIGSEGYQAITPLGKLINRIIKMFKSKIIRKLVSLAFKDVLEGFSKLNEYSKEFGTPFHNSMSVISSDFKYLGRAIATLVEPLINAIAPALDFIIGKVVDLMNLVNQFLNGILGSGTWTKANFALQEYGETADKTGGKVKKLAKQLQGIDEINNLTTNEPSGGGGANKDAISLEDMFSTENISDKVKEFVEKVKKAWETDADFTEIGREIGEWFKNAIDSIDFTKIEENAHKLGKALATGLNGFLSTPGLARDIGEKIADALNVAIAFVSDFVKNMNFMSIGTFVGQGISSALENIHWDDLKSSALGLGQGLANAINGLAGTDAIPKIGKATANLLLLGINFAYGLISTTNFTELGQKVGDAITEFFKQMNEVDPETGLTGWEKAGSTIRKLASGIKDFVLGAIAHISKEDVEQGFSDFFKKLDLSGIVIDILVLEKTLEAQIIEALGRAIFNIGKRTFLLELYLALKIIYTGKKLWKQIKDSTKKEAETGFLRVVVEVLFENPKEKLVAMWNGIVAWWNAKQPLRAITFTIQNLYSGIVSMWQGVVSYWNSKPNLKGIVFTIENLVVSIRNMWNGVVSYWNSRPILSTISANVVSFKQIVQNAWNDLRNWWNNHKPKLSAITTDIKMPHLVIDGWDTDSTLAKTVKTLFKVKGIPKLKIDYYAQGGFPEDGWFRANHGEIMGKFDNGKSVVANNRQITEGIADAVYRANQESNALLRQQNTLMQSEIELMREFVAKEFGISVDEIGNAVRAYNREYKSINGRNMFA